MPIEENEFNKKMESGEIEVVSKDKPPLTTNNDADTNPLDEYKIPLEIAKRLRFSQGTVPTHTPKNFLEQFYPYLSAGTRKLYFWIDKGWLALAAGVTDHGALTGLSDDDHTQYLKNVSEDITPSLGGDLDLNGRAIDFGTTPNITDCRDEDDMASDDIASVCTQQSIKAYVDSKAATASESVAGTIAWSYASAGARSGTVTVLGFNGTPTAVVIRTANIPGSGDPDWCEGHSDGTTEKSWNSGLTLSTTKAVNLNMNLGTNNADFTADVGNFQSGQFDIAWDVPATGNVGHESPVPINYIAIITYG